MGIFDKGLGKTNLNFFQKLGRAIVGKSKVDDNVLDALEEALLSSDMGVDTTLKVIENLEDRVERDKYVSMDELVDLIRDEIGKLLNVDGSDAPVQPFDFSKKPYVMLVVGVNGVGKTTTIGKLASMLAAQGKKVVIGAADTFRAAAVEQLTIWAERAGVDIVKQAMGSDPASVAFDTVKSAVAKGADVVLIDTAGRLHNRIDLMNELTKIRNVIRRVVPDGPHEVRPERLRPGEGVLQGDRRHRPRRHQTGRQRQGRRRGGHRGPVPLPDQVPRDWRRDRRPEGVRQEGIREFVVQERRY